MPTAAEHQAEAVALDRVLETLTALRSALDRDRDDVGLRGTTALVVDRALAGTSTRVAELARLIEALADELRRRATLCEAYTLEVRRYDEALRRWRAAVHRYRAAALTDVPDAWPGPEPVAPLPPFPGATAG